MLLKLRSKKKAPQPAHQTEAIDPGEEVTTPVFHPALIGVEDAKAMDIERISELFKSHLNPGQYHFMKLLGFHKIKIESAKGAFYKDQNGREILDFFGGFGSLALGHNHPRAMAARLVSSADAYCDRKAMAISCRSSSPNLRRASITRG